MLRTANMASDKLIDFSSEPGGPFELPTDLYWLHSPQSSTIEPGAGLKIVPTPGCDYWRKTYTNPPASSNTANALVHKFPASSNKWSVCTQFSITKVVAQFDQAGLFVYVDDLHWIKTGIEYECGVPNMSCVVCNEESDWCFFQWPTAQDVEMKADMQRYGKVLYCTISYKKDGQWRVFRTTPVYMSRPDADVSVGIMVGAPKNEEGKPQMEVVFKNIQITTT